MSAISRNRFQSSALLIGSILSAAALIVHFRTRNQNRKVIMSAPSLHPLVDNGLKKGSGSHAGGKLYCLCSDKPVEVTLGGDTAHNHLCGCSKCWKPKGALFSVVGVISRDQVKVTASGDKLAIIDESAVIQRHACKSCGAHLYGRIEKEHAFHGLDFVHTELSKESGWQEPQFAAFVSSIIEQGFNPEGIDAVRSKIESVGLKYYDCLSPPLMDALAAYSAKKAGLL